MLKNVIFLVLLVQGVWSEGLVFVTYGAKPQSELIIRYLDRFNEGCIHLIDDKGVHITPSENISFGKKTILHQVLVSGLKPGQKIFFRVGSSLERYSASSLKQGDLSFCVAGDLYRKLKFYRLGLKAIASEDPDFVIFGGDLAYTTHGPLHLGWGELKQNRYQTFIKELNQELRKKDGSLIPFITVIGNHDYQKGVDDLAYTLFFPPFAKTYFHYDLGDKLDLITLDTGHRAPIKGLQLSFLDQTLKGSQKAFKLAAYHIGAYPSVYPYEHPSAKQVREAFCPVFDLYKLDLAFEHHSHAFKITHPLKNERIDPEGTIYCGDGCLGVKPRKVKNMSAFYMKESSSQRHYYKVVLQGETLSVHPKNLQSEPLCPPVCLEQRKI
jgi:hypothetical protein